MTFARPKRINGRVPVLTAEEAVKYIPDESTLCVLGAGGIEKIIEFKLDEEEQAMFDNSVNAVKGLVDSLGL